MPVDNLFVVDGVTAALRIGMREARGDAWGVDLGETSGEAFGGGEWDSGGEALDVGEPFSIVSTLLVVVLDLWWRSKSISEAEKLCRSGEGVDAAVWSFGLTLKGRVSDGRFVGATWASSTERRRTRSVGEVTD